MGKKDRNFQNYRVYLGRFIRKNLLCEMKKDGGEANNSIFPVCCFSFYTPVNER